MGITKPTMIEKFHSISKYHRPGTKRSKTTKITIHYTGKAEVPALNTWKYFNNNNVYASSHYIVGLEGEIYYAVPMNEIAYTSNDANSYSIGIECATTGKDDHYSDKEYTSLVHLCAWLCDYYKLDPKKDIIRHYDVTKKLCPRYFVNNKDKFEQFKLDCYNLKNGKIKLSDIKNCTNGKGESTGTSGNNVSKPESNDSQGGTYIVRYLQQCLNSDYKCNLAIDGSFGKLTQSQVDKHYLNKGDKGEHVVWLQKALNNRGYKLTVDGSFGNATLEALKKYQKSRGLKADGCGGIATHKAIIND